MAIFGLVPSVASREQLAAEQFERFLATETVDATKARDMRHIFHAYLLDDELRTLIDSRAYPKVRARDAAVYQSILAAGPAQMEALVGFIRANVRLDPFTRVA